MAEEIPQFLQYPPPSPGPGVAVAHPNQGKPLLKLMKHMLKPPGKRDIFHSKHSKPKRKTKFY